MVGILVGGASRRMGGHPKGLLRVPDGGECVLERLVRVSREAGLDVVLMGDARPYEGVVPGVPRLKDRPPGIGPLGGLAAALHHAGPRSVILTGCDMPYVSVEVLGLLSGEEHGAAIVAPRRSTGEGHEPLLARYACDLVGPVLDLAIGEGVRSFRDLFRRCEVRELVLTDLQRQTLCDWDSPADIG